MEHRCYALLWDAHGPQCGGDGVVMRHPAGAATSAASAYRLCPRAPRALTRQVPGNSGAKRVSRLRDPGSRTGTAPCGGLDEGIRLRWPGVSARSGWCMGPCAALGTATAASPGGPPSNGACLLQQRSVSACRGQMRVLQWGVSKETGEAGHSDATMHKCHPSNHLSEHNAELRLEWLRQTWQALALWCMARGGLVARAVRYPTLAARPASSTSARWDARAVAMRAC
jgi:hypothetical protein